VELAGEVFERANKAFCKAIAARVERGDVTGADTQFGKWRTEGCFAVGGKVIAPNLKAVSDAQADFAEGKTNGVLNQAEPRSGTTERANAHFTACFTSTARLSVARDRK